MHFEWDGAKNRRNIAKHRIRFETAQLVFDDPNALSIQDRDKEDEVRWQTLAMIGNVIVVLVAHTYRDENGEEVIRMISARKATPQERRAYEKTLKSSR